MPARDVKVYVKRNKNDSADAEAICDAVRQPTVRSVQSKSAEQQSQLMLHRTRDLLMRQRTQVINALRAHLEELGIAAAQGTAGSPLSRPRPMASVPPADLSPRLHAGLADDRGRFRGSEEFQQ